MMNKTPQAKINSIEFFRTFFCLAVIFYHVTMGSIIPYTKGNAFYKWCSSAFANSGFVVECFFIISGYFLMASMRKHGNMSVMSFVLSKVRRLWPVFVVSSIVTHFMTRGIWTETIVNSLFLQMTGFTFNFRGTNWYVSAMFWSLVFYFLLLKCITDRYRRYLVILLVSWFGYVINLQTHPPMGFGREVVFSVFNLGLMRGVAGVGLGILINEFVESVKPYFSRRLDWRIILVATALEVLSLYLLIAHLFFREWTCRNHFVVVVAFAMLLPILVLRAGGISRLLDCKAFGVLGKYTYSMYVMQQAGFWILQRTLWLDTAFVTGHVGLTLVLSVAVPAVVGVAAYYLIELPGARLLDAAGSLLNKGGAAKEDCDAR